MRAVTVKTVTVRTVAGEASVAACQMQARMKPSPLNDIPHSTTLPDSGFVIEMASS